MPLKYKPERINPQGRPKVYFCCHPEDFARHFEPLTDQILKLHNCTIWYPGEERPDLADLKEMQLFVMPVTWKLLRTENNALMIEFPFAIEHHIPVLPLMMDSGMDELFNAKCGDLQYLDPYAQDETTLSFEKKLEKFLASILIGDELAAKIRGAFDAYIFLSYRKKDRKYAQKLMRLIHRSEFCRDIAIWYDEFLVPGESFNDAIREALEKSGLFVLTVTPNLVNEPNYVQSTEYPMARQAGKPILPAEMSPTDRAALESQYEGIPDCAAPEDKTALSEALLERLRGIAIQANDRDPEHDFFIGLAYLGGVDVEVDHERSLALITGAAEEGLVEAMTKLAEMYYTGQVVERNYQTSLEWQEKKLARLEELYALGSTEERMSDLFLQYIECGNACIHIGARVRAEEHFTQGLKLAANQQESPKSRRWIAEASRCLGYVHQQEGRMAQARIYYEQALEILKALAAETGTSEDRWGLFNCLTSMGDLCKAEGSLSGLRHWQEQAVKLRRVLVEETGTMEDFESLTAHYRWLGTICEAEDNLTGARCWHEQAVELSQSFIERTCAVDDYRFLSSCYCSLGNICKDEGNLPRARHWYEQSLELSRSLAAETNSVEVKHDLALTHYRMAEISDGEERQNWLRQAAYIWEQLTEVCPQRTKFRDYLEFVRRDLD